MVCRLTVKVSFDPQILRRYTGSIWAGASFGEADFSFPIHFVNSPILQSTSEPG